MKWTVIAVGSSGREISPLSLHPPCPGACETEHPHGNSGSWSLDKRSWSPAAATVADCRGEPAQLQGRDLPSPSLASSQRLHSLVSASDFYSKNFCGKESKFPISYSFFMVAGTKRAAAVGARAVFGGAGVGGRGVLSGARLSWG